MGEDLEVRYHSVIDVLFRHFQGITEEKHKSSARIYGVPGKTQTERLSNANIGR
jgi:hypothetical protein